MSDPDESDRLLCVRSTDVVETVAGNERVDENGVANCHSTRECQCDPNDLAKGA